MIKILQNVSIGPLSNLPSRTRRTNRIGPYKVHEDKSFCFSFMCISSKVDLRQADPTVHLLQRVRIGQLFRESLWLHFWPKVLRNFWYEVKISHFSCENYLGKFLKTLVHFLIKIIGHPAVNQHRKNKYSTVIQ